MKTYIGNFGNGLNNKALILMVVLACWCVCPVLADDLASDWSNSVEVYITNASGIDGVQAQFPVDYRVGMQTNFADIRFTCTDGVTTIPYWVESQISGSYANVWLKLPADQDKIWMWYGNSNATSASDGEATFELYDDFSTDTSSRYTQTEFQSGNHSFSYDSANHRLKSETDRIGWATITAPVTSGSNSYITRADITIESGNNAGGVSTNINVVNMTGLITRLMHDDVEDSLGVSIFNPTGEDLGTIPVLLSANNTYTVTALVVDGVAHVYLDENLLMEVSANATSLLGEGFGMCVYDGVQYLENIRVSLYDDVATTFSIAGPVTANFTTEAQNVLINDTVYFVDTSIGIPTSWFWEFGDGYNSTLQNPEYTYAQEGTYTINLTVANSVTSDTITKTDYLSVYAPIIADFTIDSPNILVNAPVSFNDTSTGAPTTWFWEFGDGHTSTLQNPEHAYIQSGIYSVNLTATNPVSNGTLTKTDCLSVYSPIVANFSSEMQDILINEPVSFIDSSTGVPTSWLWEFGDGTNSTLQNPEYAYTQEGVYTIKLTATHLLSGDVLTKTDYISVYSPVVANFASDVQDILINVPVNFTDTTTGAPESWFWEFGDGNTSTLQNPEYAYARVGTYDITLTTTNPASNDSLSKIDFITVWPVVVGEFSSDKQDVILNENVTFTDLTLGDPTSWVWEFGDGANSVLQNPVYAYNQSGKYSVTLMATSSMSGDVITKVDYVSAYRPVVADFIVNKPIALVNETVVFIDQSGGDLVTWEWDFGDGGTSTSSTPTHSYATAGNYTVSLTVTNPASQDIKTRSEYMQIGIPPIVEIGASVRSGDKPFVATIIDQSIGGVDYLWTFGDGSYSNTSGNQVHTYSEYGEYPVSVNVTNKWGCTEGHIEGGISVIDTSISADFSANRTAGYGPLVVRFTPEIVGNCTGVVWTFGDGDNSIEFEPTHTFVSPGYYTVTMTANNPWNLDTVVKTKMVNVWGPLSVDFNATPLYGYLPLTVSFQSDIVGDYDTIYWAFGDGGTSNLPNPTHIYALEDVYSVTLEVKKINGGSESCFKFSYINAITKNIPATNARYPLSNYDYQNSNKIPGALGKWGSVIWESTAMGGHSDGNIQPVIDADGYIYAGTIGGVFAKIDPESGEAIWTAPQVGHTINSPALRQDGGVYVNQGGGKPFICLNTADGSEMINKSYVIGDSICGSPVIDNDGYVVILINGGEDTIVIKNDAEANPVWNAIINANVGEITPAIDPSNGNVYITTNDLGENHLFAYGVAGDLKWEFPINQASGISPVVGSEGQIYVLTSGLNGPALAYCIGPNGNQKWVSAVGGVVSSSASLLSDNAILVVTTDDLTGVRQLKKLSASSGSIMWSVVLGFGETNPIVTNDGYYYVGGYFGYDLVDRYGQLQKSVAIQDLGDNTPIPDYVDGKLYGIRGDGTLVAIDTNVKQNAIASYTASSYTGVAPAVITLTDTSTPLGGVQQRVWQIGNKTYYNEEAPAQITHKFTEAGAFDIGLFIYCEGGATSHVYDVGRIIISKGAIIEGPPFTDKYNQYARIHTMGVTKLSGYAVTLWGELEGAPTDVWFEYGTTQNRYGHKSRSYDTGGEFSAHLDGIVDGLVAGETYYYRAACSEGYGEQKSFALVATDGHKQTDYAKDADKFIFIYEDPDNAITDVAESVWSPYVGMFGAFFAAIVIGAVFFNMAAKQRKLFIPALLILLVGGTLWAMLPPEAMMIAQMFLIMGMAGIVYWFLTRR